jgi:thioester reductase-like protein
MTDSNKFADVNNISLFSQNSTTAQASLVSVLSRFDLHIRNTGEILHDIIHRLGALEGKSVHMDQKLTGRVNDINERMEAAPRGDLGAQMLEVIDDNGTVSDALGEISREAARDVVDNFDFGYHHVENAVRDAIDNIDLSDSIDWESLHASQFDTRDFAECISEETPFIEALRSVDDHEERLDMMGDQMCMVIGMLERIGIATEPSSHTELFGDKRNVNQVYGDLVAKMSEDMTPDQRNEHLELLRQTVAENKEKAETDAQHSS